MFKIKNSISLISVSAFVYLKKTEEIKKSLSNLAINLNIC